MTDRLLAFLALSAASFAQSQHDTTNAVLWTQTSAEAHAVAVQTYRSAERQLLLAVKDTNWTAALEQSGEFQKLPPAVILDLDETVIDNSPMQARLIKENRKYGEAEWGRWIKESRAGLIPGAVDFLKVAHGAGVAIFYITNRVCDPNSADDPTVVNLKHLALPFDPQRLFCRSETGDKSPRRARVASAYRVLLLIGDDFNDFVTVPETQMNVEARRAIAAAHDRYWGDRWFMLPNPMYGNWERAAGANKIDALRK